MARKTLAISVATLVALSGATQVAHPMGSATARVAPAGYAGTVAITDYQFPDSLPPGGAYSNGVADTEIAGALFDSPLGFDQHGNFYADLATEVPSTTNGGIKVVNGVEIVTVHLKPNQKWSDGSPITPADYILGLLLDFAPEINATNGVDEIKAVRFSGNDMIVTYKGLYAPALSYGLPGSPLEPLAYMEKKYGITLDPKLTASYDAGAVAALYRSAAYKGSNLQKFVLKYQADSYNSPSDVTNGPYKLAEWTPDQRITLVPNPYYTALPADPHHPRPAKIQFVVVSENPNTLVQDMAASSTYASIDKAEDFGLTDVPALKRSKYQVVVPDALDYEHVEFNLTNPALKDARVRQALYYAVDKPAYLRALFPGLSDATYGKIALTSPFPSVSPWSNNNSLPRNAYNPSRARSLLAAAGYATSLGGSGKHLQLDFVTTNSSFRIRSAQLLQRLWAQIGVAIRIRYAAPYGTNGLFSTYADGGLLFHHQFDVAEFAFQTYPDPDQTIANVEPQYIPDANHPTDENYSEIDDARVTRDLDQARVTLDTAKRHQLYDDFQTYFVQQAYWIMLFNRPNIQVFKGTIGNYRPNVTQAGTEWNAYQWWVDPSGSQKAQLS